jgi:hypothetical protein
MSAKDRAAAMCPTDRDFPGKAGPQRSGVRSVGTSKAEAHANAVLIQKAPNLFCVMDDVNNALYRVEGDPEGLLRINRSSLLHFVERPCVTDVGDVGSF